MKNFLLLLPILSFNFFGIVYAKVNIFACEPEWASLAEEITKEKGKVFSATNALQDPHYLRARPSLFAKIRRADLLVCSGAGLEVGWLPILLQKANAKIQPGKVGNLIASDFVNKLEIPTNIDRSLGDIHPDGNPHIHLDPNNIALVAKEIYNRLAIIDSKNADYYQENLAVFLEKWDNKTKEWDKRKKKLQGKKIVTYHKSFNYLIKWIDASVLISMEPKPGIPPNISHLEKILSTIRSEKPYIIIRTPYEPKDAGDWIEKKINIKQNILPYTVGGNENSKDLFSLFDETLNILLAEEENGNI